MSSGADLYATLNIGSNASIDEIKKAYKRLAVENHPDKHQGCKEREEKFKAINQAYAVLSDPDKRSAYDRCGTIDGSVQPDLNDILRSVFGAGGPQMPGGGFQFVFMDGAMPGMAGDDVFAQMFGGMNMRGGSKQHANKHDVVEVAVDICDIYYGNNKRVEFELLEQCAPCGGSGASDPTQIIHCMTCKGKGELLQQIGPFMNKIRCPSCSGNGSAIKKPCAACKGQKTAYHKKAFDLRLPKGIPHNHEVRMPGRGSYNPATKQNKDMVFKFKHNIQEPYKFDENMNVVYKIPITIEELIGGFQKLIKLYRDDVAISSDRYFNPSKHVVLKNRGVFSQNRGEQTDLHLKFEIEFTESERLSKYRDVFHKIFKKTSDLPEGVEVIDLHSA